MKAFRYKIRRPGKTVLSKFEQTLYLCCELYNAALQERRDAWKLNRISLSYLDQANQLSDIKLLRGDLNATYSQVLQDVLRRLDKTFKDFFLRIKNGAKTGFPRFKNQNRFDSFCFPQSGFKLDADKLRLSKIGTVRVHLSRPIEGKIKTCIIKREADGWYVIFTVENEKQLLPKTGKAVGIDVGIENFITLSDGTQINNFKFFENAQKQLRKVQRKISRRKSNSSRRLKAVNQFRKIHQKITRQRNDFVHKVSTDLVKNYDLIAVEKLNVLGMCKSILAKQIQDVAWGSFFLKLKYKAENAGREVLEVNPNGTSQTCICGETVKKDLSVRWHHCLSCGLSEHRDIVSAKVILNRAGQTRKDLTWAITSSVFLESPIRDCKVR